MARKIRKPVKIAFALAALAAGTALVINNTIIPNAQYNQAAELMNRNEYAEAMTLYEKLGSFRDSEKMTEECRKGMMYLQGVSEMNAGEYVKAADSFASAGDFKDSEQLRSECEAAAAEQNFESLVNEGRLTDALELLQNSQSLANKDQKLNDLAVRFYEGGESDFALKALDLMKDQEASNSDLRSEILEKKEAEKLSGLYEELSSLTIDDSESVGQALTLLEQLPADYENVSDYQTLLDIYAPYIGTYIGPEYLGNAVIRIENLEVYLETSVITLPLEPPNLAASYYTDEANNAIFTVADTNTITVIMSDNGNIIYESFIRD